VKALHDLTTLIGKSDHAMKFDVIRLIALIVLASLTAQAANSTECTEKDPTRCTLLSEQPSRNTYDEQLAVYSSGSILPLMHTEQKSNSARSSSATPIRKPKAAVKPALRGLNKPELPNVAKVYDALDSQGRRDLKECFSLMTDDEIRKHLPGFDRNTASINFTARPVAWFSRKTTDTDQTLCQNYFKSIFQTN
jgi:hypothetical protein